MERNVLPSIRGKDAGRVAYLPDQHRQLGGRGFIIKNQYFSESEARPPLYDS